MREIDLSHSSWWSELEEFGSLVLRRKRENIGLTQTQMAAKIGVHRSRISRIERGLGTPKDVASARVFAIYYGLSKDETNTMYRLWFGTNDYRSTQEGEIEPIYAQLPELLYKVRIDGSPKTTIELTQDLSGRIREYIKYDDYSPTTMFYKNILARMLSEQLTAYTEISPKNRILIDVDNPIKEMANIVKETQDKCINGLVHLHWGDAFYIAGNYPKSLKYLAYAWQYLNDADAQLRLLRIQALCYAHLNDASEVIKVGMKIKNVIDQGDFSTLEHLSLAYEGLGQAQSLVYSSEAFDTLQKGWEIYNNVKEQGGKATIRFIQLSRSQLGAIVILTPNDKRLIESKGMEYLKFAQILGYPRHEERIITLLKTHL